MSLPGARDMRQRGKPSEKPVIVVDDSRDLRLLQHQLGNENPVRIPRATPWEVPTMPAKPAPEPASELCPSFGRNEHGLASGRNEHGLARTAARSAPPAQCGSHTGIAAKSPSCTPM